MNKPSFSQPGDILGQWRYERRLTHREKIALYRARAYSADGRKLARSAIRRDWVIATCLSCGEQHPVRADTVRSGRSRRCKACRTGIRSNPYARPDHPLYPVYTRLVNMDQRCSNPRNPAYSDYGGRGITVDARYSVSAQTRIHGSGRHAVDNLIADIGLPPDGDFGRFQIDRITNDGADRASETFGYHPGNLRWADGKTQARNRRNTALVPVGKEQWMSICELAELTGLKPKTLKWRLKSGNYPTLGDAVTAVGGTLRSRMIAAMAWVAELLRKGRYWASPDGRIFSIKPNGIVELEQNLTPDGYCVVKLCFAGSDVQSSRPVRVHRMVALQYHVNPDPETHLIVAHLDDDPLNNHKDNLRWATFAINAQAIHGSVVYPGTSPCDLSPFDEAEIRERMRSEFIDHSDYQVQAETYLRWGTTREALLPRVAADPRYRGSLYDPDSPYAALAWRFLLAPSNRLRFEDGDITIAVRISGQLSRQSIFSLTPARDWSAYFVWYPNELAAMGVDFSAHHWLPRPLEEPARTNIRNLLYRNTTPLPEQHRIVNHSLFVQYPHKARLLFPSPVDGTMQHPLYIRSASRAPACYFRCEGCMRRILAPMSPRSVTREATKGLRRPLCAHCQKRKSVGNLTQTS